MFMAKTLGVILVMFRITLVSGKSYWCIYIYIYIYICVCVCVFVCVLICVCLCVLICVWMCVCVSHILVFLLLSFYVLK